MILKFGEYTALNEEVAVNSFKDIKINKAWGTYAEMIRGFKSSHYDFLGTIFCDRKTINAFKSDGFNKAFEGKAKEFKKDFYDTYLSVSLSPEPDNHEAYDKFDNILSERNIDEVTSCKTKSGKVFYVFFNRDKDKKYFYFLSTSYDSEMLEIWLRIRTKGEDVVYDELSEESRKKEEIRKEREELRAKEEEKRRMEAERRKKIDSEYKRYVDILKKDVEENPENYEDVKSWGNLPEEIKDAINGDIKESDFVEYKIRDNEYFNPYGEEKFFVYVNDRRMTKGYTCVSYEGGPKPGQYVGD